MGRSCVFRLGLGALFLVLGVSRTAAAQADDCPVWFPDLHCDRQGRYEGFVMPMASPFLFEEPFVTTGISVWGVRHTYPDDSVFQGGELWAGAVQIRVAVTDRLAFIATKDGFAFHRPDNPILFDEEGFLDLAAGFKYALVDMPERSFILTPSLRFEIPAGSSHVFSGNGSGTAIPAVSTAWGRGDFHVVADIGGRIPFDRDEQSTSIFYHLHADYRILEYLAPFAELSGYTWADSGDGELDVRTELGPVELDTAQALLGTGPFEGADLVNLGSAGVAGNDLLTLSLGLRAPVTPRLSLGLAYELPLTEREDIFEDRITLNAIFEL